MLSEKQEKRRNTYQFIPYVISNWFKLKLLLYIQYFTILKFALKLFAIIPLLTSYHV